VGNFATEVVSLESLETLIIWSPFC